jgi:hypothetical protein
VRALFFAFFAELADEPLTWLPAWTGYDRPNSKNAYACTMVDEAIFSCVAWQYGILDKTKKTLYSRLTFSCC